MFGYIKGIRSVNFADVPVAWAVNISATYLHAINLHICKYTVIPSLSKGP